MTTPKKDREIIWHPFTQEKNASDSIVIKRAEGSYVYDDSEKSYLDLISSWWVNLHGHAHPDIAKSIYEQSLKLEHIIFAGFTHEPAINLCEGLREVLPNELCRFFFSDNGSTAVEVALKMAYQYWRNRGAEKRKFFLSFDGGYHGDTFGAMSVGFKSGFHDVFSDLLFDVLTIPYPATWDNDMDVEFKENNALKTLKQLLKKHGEHIAAIILEPLVQGASGMRIVRPAFIKSVIELVRENDILVIFDEVMTGFGRTGTIFALHQTGVTPDFLCISKGITGGFLPLALTVTNNNIYSAFLHDEWKFAFAHGHSYTANPLACAAAITSLKLLRSEKCQESINNITESHKRGISLLKATCKKVKNTRIIGTISAFEIDTERPLNFALKSRFFQEGLLIRPLGNSVYLLPPYSTSPSELNQAYVKICSVVNFLSTTEI